MSTPARSAAPDAAAVLFSQAIEAIASRVAQLIANVPAAESKTEGAIRRFLDLKEAARYTRLGASTLRRLQARGDVAKIKVGGRVLFAVEDLDEFMAQHRCPARHEAREPARVGGAAAPCSHDAPVTSRLPSEPDPFANYTPRAPSTRIRKPGRLPQSSMASNAKA